MPGCLESIVPSLRSTSSKSDDGLLVVLGGFFGLAACMRGELLAPRS